MSESITHLSRRCPKCGRILQPDALEGLCASCLLTAGAETLTTTRQSGAFDGGAGASGTASAPRPVEGAMWGPYRIVRLLGRGGMGEVFEAEQTDTGRRVALKVLRDTLRTAEDRARFLREGQLAASISHPHTVYIYGSEEVAGAPAITMELLSAGTLKDRVSAEGPMPSSEAVSAVLDIIGGLDAAQSAGVLHRDIKPSNCFVDSEGTVKVGDFGLSISTLARDVRHELATAGFEGTPQFAAPEQLRGEPLDVRADIYAVGATLYYLLTGRAPIDAPDLRDLVSRVQSETPASPRAIRSDVPKGLAGVVLRCLAKSAVDRPQTYAELADLLRPFLPARDVPAPLGLRLVAWIADGVIVSAAGALLFAAVPALSLALGRVDPQVIVMLSAGSWLVSMSYFALLEGLWGATLGKRFMGLRVRSRTPGAWWGRIVLRAAIFHLPSAVQTLAVMGAAAGMLNTGGMRVGYSVGVDASNGWHMPLDGLLALALGLLLISTARRSNHWTLLHDFVTGTRVVRAHAVDRAPVAATPVAPRLEIQAAASPAQRFGPYSALSLVGQTGGGRLFICIDPILRRHVWIHEVAPGTPSVSPARRDVARPGRLYWLAGRRSETENWDAFEAPHGEPLLATSATAEWRDAHRALLSLVHELEASVANGAAGHLTLAHVWKREDGRLVLLDFPWPESRAVAETAPLSPVALVSAVFRQVLAPAARLSAPLTATTLFDSLASVTPPPLADVKARLERLSSTPTRPSRVRRAFPMVIAAMPVATVLVAAVAMIPMLARVMEGEKNEMITWLTWLDETGEDAEFKTPAQRTAAEQYVADRFRTSLTSDDFWDERAFSSEPFTTLRRNAAAIAAQYPAVPDEDLARASAMLAPQIEHIRVERDKWPVDGEGLRSVVVSGLAAVMVCFSLVWSLISALAVPGGLVTRVLGHAVVHRGGREIGRVRSLLRVLIAWSPVIAWIAVVGLPIFGEPRAVSPEVSFLVGSAALAIMVAGAAWTIARPSRGPHDRLAGTWMVPR